jgi:ABC-type transport system involved in multi-copper enzyme maturation permease subunit
MKSIHSFSRKFITFFVNPIIVKELRSRMRGARAFITLTSVLIMMSIISYGLYKLVLISSAWSYTPLSPQIGQTLFTSIAVIEILMICLVTPAVTSGAISSEHEKLTYEMLLTTPLKPTQILWGKLVSALGYIFLLVFAAIPMASLVFIYGGVAPRDMLKALIVLLATAIMLGTIGIFMSTWLKRSGRATIASYLIVLVLLGVPTVVYGIIGVIRQAEPPRWLLVPSPINALFSAIAPSTSLGNSALSMIGSLGMLLGGNIGAMISADSIPRPLYHYTLPLYGVVSLVLYLLSTRLIRPTRRWTLKTKDILFGFSTVGIFIIITGIGFAISSNRYENVSIFTPTPFVPMPLEQMVEPAVGMPVSDEEAIEIFSSALQTMQQDDFLSDLDFVAISRQTYPEPSSPIMPENMDPAGFLLSNYVSEGVTDSAQELPFDLIWVDNFEKSFNQDIDNSDEFGDVQIVFGYLNPLKTGLIAFNATIYYQDHSLNLHFRLSNADGSWKVSQYETDQERSPSSKLNQLNLHLTFDEMAEIYGAAILQAYVVDNPHPETEISKFYLLQSTGLAVDSIRLSPEVQSGIRETLVHMPFEIQWIENRDAISLTETDDTIDTDSAVVTFGPILPNDKNGAAQVMIEVEFGTGDSILATYILDKIDGVWKITDLGGMG